MIDYSINVHGRLMSLGKPCVMGILNCTPDSFFAGSRKQTEAEIADRANQIIQEGGRIIDVGAFSTRPGAAEVTEAEEMARLRFALPIVRREQPDAAVSVDTFRPNVARMVVEELGADIINDVSEGGITGIVDTPLDLTADAADAEGCGGTAADERFASYPAIFRMMGRLKVPYILMSVQPTLRDMMLGFAREVQQLRDLTVKDIILDPGFGFGKTRPGNFRILDEMDKLQVLGLPVLAAMSRKRMVFETLESTPAESLNGTTVVNTMALMRGASIIRVHDVRPAVEAVKIYNALCSSNLA